MQVIPESSLIAQLKAEDNAAFTVLYGRALPAIEKYIVHNHGDAADAADVFQEAMIVLLQKLRQEDFVLTASLNTYLFAIARNLWLKRLRDRRLVMVGNIEQYDDENTGIAFELQTVPAPEEKLTSWLTKITLNCQRILKAIFFYREPMGSLMQKMGWKNKHTAANQQYKCIQQIKREKGKEKED